MVGMSVSLILFVRERKGPLMIGLIVPALCLVVIISGTVVSVIVSRSA